MKENFEDKIIKLLGKSEERTALRMKLENLIEKIKKAVEKREWNKYDYDHLIDKFIREEGIIPKDSRIDYDLINEVSNGFHIKYGAKCLDGMKTYYVVFDTTPLSEESEKDIGMFNGLSSKVEEYINSCGGKPDPKNFREFVSSILPEEIKKAPDYNDTKLTFYKKMRIKFFIKGYKDVDID